MKAKRRERENPPREKIAAPPAIISKGLIFGIAAALVIAALIVYAQTFHYGFVAYDDDQYVYQNPMVKAGLSASGISWALTTFFYANWHPLTWISYMLDAQLFGLNPGWFHTTNVLLHVGATILLFLALVRMTRQPLRCALVAGIFALHPLHVESVAWISERKDVLSTFLEMLALLLYARFVESRKPARYFGLAVVFALSLMAKPMLVTFPFVLLLLDFWPLRRFQWPPRWPALQPLLLEKIPLLALSAVASILTFTAQRSYGAVAALSNLPLSTRVANAAISYVAYIGQALWPSGLGVLYPGAPPDTDLAILATVILLAITGAALWCAASRPYFLTGWLLYLGILVPVIGLVQVGVQSRADRYTYVPMVGLSLAIVWFIGDWLATRPQLRTPAIAVSSLVLLAFAAAAYRQASYWRDSRTLFEHTLAVTQRNHIITNNLGVTLAGEKDFQGAVNHYREALRYSPDYPEAHANLGHEMLHGGQMEEAAKHLEEAIRLKPDSPVAQADYGLLLAARGDYQGAAQHLGESLRIAPAEAINHSNLCFVLLHAGRPAEALQQCDEALRLQPDLADAHFNRGNVLAAQARKTEARAEFQTTLRLNPQHPAANSALLELSR